MKKLILIVFLFGSLTCFSQISWFDYFKSDYFVSETGNDNNSGTKPWDAWATVAKVNATTFVTGDRIAFNRGDEWDETLLVSKDSITFKAFGSGANPTIAGLDWNDVDFPVVFYSNITFGAVIEYWPENYDGNIFYVSADGSDSNPGTKSEPFATITKVNTLTLAGDNAVLFNSQDSFAGTITVGQSGTSVTFGAYGVNSSKPVISGFTTITGWTQVNDSIWSKVLTAESDSINMVLVDGVNTGMGRYPNTGTWLTYESNVADVSITDNQLTGSPDWTGAEAVIRTGKWTLERARISNHATSTLTVTPEQTTFNFTNGYGYFIQDDLRTLDTDNEWYFDRSTNTFYIHGNPAGKTIQVSTSNLNARINDKDYITFKNINFEGANQHSIHNTSGQNIVIENCTFENVGMTAIYTDASSSNASMTIDGNIINGSNNNAIHLRNSTTSSVIKNNTITNIGMIHGMATNVAGAIDNAYDGVLLYNNNTSEYNSLSNVGHSGFALRTNPGMIIRNNYVSNFGMTRYDGGGIYAYSINENDSTWITNNIVIGSNAESDGIAGATDLGLRGIYIDDTSEYIRVSGNTVANIKGQGLYILNSDSTAFIHNTAFNNDIQLGMTYAFDYGVDIKGMNVKHNKLISKTATQLSMAYRNSTSVMNAFGVADSNYYARPIDDSDVLQTHAGSTITNRNLAAWRTVTGQDANSFKSPYVMTDTADFRIEYNATKTAKTVALTGTWYDVEENEYTTSVTIQPYESVVLMRNVTEPPVMQDLILEDLIAYWSLDGTTLVDTINGNNLTNSGAVVGVTGKNKAGVQFDTNSDDLYVDYQASLVPVDSTFTVSLWVYLTDNSADSYLFSFYQSGSLFSIRVRSDGRFYASCGGNVETATGVIQLNQWHHVTWVVNGAGNRMMLYVDGVSRGNNINSSGYVRPTAGSYLTLGAQYKSATNAIVGTLDEVLLSDKAFTQEMVDYLYKLGDGRFYNFNE